MSRLSPLSDHRFGDLVVQYLSDPDGRVSLHLHPAEMADQAKPDESMTWTDPMVHLAISGDPQPHGLSAGRTMRWSVAGENLRYRAQTEETTTAGARSVVTELSDGTRVNATHRLTPVESPHGTALEVSTTITNISSAPVTLEMVSSFSLSGLTSYASDDAPERMVIRRFGSAWTDEGRLITDRLEDLQLERTWGVAGVSERFGQIGSLPVRRWFPTVVVEDEQAQVAWGARLAWAGSWQCEIARRENDLALSGGQADREFGHWRHTLAPGASFTGPTAWISCSTQGFEDVCQRLLAPDWAALATNPEVENDLPLIFNEWCTSWGEPHHDGLIKIADAVKELGITYLVIDAGWYRPSLDPDCGWFSNQGDWQPNAELYPNGLAATAAAIRERGLIPGIWFEAETVGADSAAFQLTDHLLTRDGLPLATHQRRFWDLNDPWVVSYFDERIIGLLRDNDFGYVKIDYNESLGFGCDHPDGMGAGLYHQTLGSRAFFERMAQQLPDLVIENCASGGHRLEASMLQRSSMSSFSDAHETPDAPIIAAAVHRLMLPRQNQIWAVLRPGDDADRAVYTLATGFLGRLCLSGDILALNEEQLAFVRHATELYRATAPIIRDGRSVIHDHTAPARRHPRGWQSVVRRHESELLVVAHAFADAPDSLTIDLGSSDWQIADSLHHSWEMRVEGSTLMCTGVSDFSAAAVHLTRSAK